MGMLKSIQQVSNSEEHFQTIFLLHSNCFVFKYFEDIYAAGGLTQKPAKSCLSFSADSVQMNCCSLHELPLNSKQFQQLHRGIATAGCQASSHGAG